MVRDRPKPGQERVVIARSGNICAYPECNLELVIDATHPDDQAKATGKVAHIRAASPEGPRYDESMTEAERGDANNLMYLCGPHHDAVDAQTSQHTVEWLTDAKLKHESLVRRSVVRAMGQVSFVELEAIVSSIVSVDNAASQVDLDLRLPLEVEQKIEANSLGEGPRTLIQAGRAKVRVVERYIRFANGIKPEFSVKLVARFKSSYYDGVAQGLTGDDLFFYLESFALENASAMRTPVVQASAVAVVSYLFELCEVFERESASA